ncbi:Dna-directed rna polymerase subunit alpha [Thalictrum thalictroides]|uniref:Dna-directed rna polymerase subunit alpha n=1 Tax=Thalictrum thalictroides TaxID=46969 RepID=A0A7J6WR39_THATH|nr:Dna-directed rna polymerase subunit alpha [Thalictrum thalictroides]
MDYEAEGKISKWYVIPYSDESCGDDRLACSVHLQKFALPGDYHYSDYGRERMILVKADTNKVVNKTEADDCPWLSLGDWVEDDLDTAFERARDTMGQRGAEMKVPRFVIRFGKILFQPKRKRSVSLKSFSNGSDVEDYLSNFYRRYHVNVPDSFVEATLNDLVPKSGLDFDDKKEHYAVKVYDRFGSHGTLLCKCSAIEGDEGVGELDLKKIELDKERQLDIDISCLDKNLDLRLQLSRKRFLLPVEDDERHSLRKLIRTGVVDSKEKCGLRWPLGRESPGGRYRVDEVASSTGEVTQDASLRIPELTMQLRDKSKPIPSADMLHDTLKNSKQQKSLFPGTKILYAKDSVFRWIVAPDDQDDQLASSIRLKEFSCESIERKDGQKPMILVCDRAQEEMNEKGNSFDKSPWVSIVQKIQEDLLASFQIARSEVSKDGEQNVPRFVIRFGKILFQDSPSINLDDVNNSSDVENVLGLYKKRYYTNVPTSFVDAVLGDYVPRIGLDFVEEKENYYVKVCDKSRPHVTISCKCRVTEAVGELDTYKIELNELRHLIADISCLDKNLDLRLLLSSKRILTSLTDDDKDSLSNILKSAVIDSEVKGGLRWPLGKESFGDRYIVVGVWHTKAKTFSNSSMRLKVRHADRFDFRTSTGEVSQEASLRVPELTKLLRDENLDLNSMIDMVRDTLKLIWGHFLQWEGSLT